MKVFLNIGLVPAAGKWPTPAQDWLAAEDFFRRYHAEHGTLRLVLPRHGGKVTEPTLVGFVLVDNMQEFRRRLLDLAVSLHQDAIAYREEAGLRGEPGECGLIGPCAEAWGAFNPDFFEE